MHYAASWICLLFFSVWSISSSILCKLDLMIINSSSQLLSGKVLLSPSILPKGFAGCISLTWHLRSFCRTFVKTFMVFNVSSGNLAVILVELLYVWHASLFEAFDTLVFLYVVDWHLYDFVNCLTNSVLLDFCIPLKCERKILSLVLKFFFYTAI